MIKFWLHEKDPFFISDDRKFEDGSMRLACMAWSDGMYDWYDVKIGVGFLTKGFTI